MAKTETKTKEKTKKRFCCCFFPKRAMSNDNQSNGTPSQQTQQSLQKVPFCGELPQNLTVGSVICVSGFVPPNSIRFSVNLISGKGQNADIAFHFNPRLDRNYVVRNCRLAGHWGEEETASIVKCNIPRNKKFEIAIFIANEEFLVSINGKHFCSFGFRVALNLVTSIEVHGLVEIQGVEYKTWTVYPESKPENVPFNIAIGEGQTEISEEALTIPCTGHLPKGFQEGWQLEICGRVKLLPHSFYINLQDGAQLWPHPIIPLHLNPRFSVSVGENVFVRNAWLNGRWGPEERTPGFQFSPGAPFSLAIRRGSDHFSVWVDGQLTGEFKFRIPIEKIDTVYIQGDVIIKQIVMHDKFIDFFNKN
ncbi:hypothetical protein ILUMI_01977 [Ignelater luminosus]|uniref:Galectin n=1 Tax=Ignelater luminosus TaxID=2038154 RepID=A0A8K0GLR4_IGNLU|nr:hypothetical protein ILUMI_01977 [Ignelater luminosus]